MANQSAWDKGWEMGAGKTKRADQKDDSDDSKKSGKKSRGKSASGTGAGGGNPWSILNYLPKLKTGGTIKKTGLALLHKGEYVVPAKHRSAKKAARKRTVIKH